MIDTLALLITLCEDYPSLASTCDQSTTSSHFIVHSHIEQDINAGPVFYRRFHQLLPRKYRLIVKKIAKSTLKQVVSDQCIKMNEGREHETCLQSMYLQSLWKNIFCGCGQHTI